MQTLIATQGRSHGGRGPALAEDGRITDAAGNGEGASGV
jgi:hypothetical protein